MLLRWCCLLWMTAMMCAHSGVMAEFNHARCIVQQDDVNVPPTIIVQPNGDLLFNQLQYAVDRCPFTDIFIPPSTKPSSSINCLTIGKQGGPFRILGATSIMADNRSTIVFNASACAMSERRALIELIDSQHVVFESLFLQVLEVDLPPRVGNFYAMSISYCTNVTLYNVSLDLAASNVGSLVGWEGLLSVNYSNTIAINFGRYLATTYSYFADPHITFPPNITFPLVHIIAIAHTQGVNISGTQATVSSGIGKIGYVHNCSQVSVTDVLAFVILMLPPPMQIGNTTITPPTSSQHHMLTFTASHEVAMLRTNFEVICGVSCNQALFAAVVHILGDDTGSVVGYLIKDTSLTFAGKWTPQWSSLVASSFIVFAATEVACVVLDNISSRDMESITSNVVVMQVMNITTTVLSRIALSLSNGGVLPMQQSVRYIAPQNMDAGFLFWDAISAPPLEPRYLLATFTECIDLIPASSASVHDSDTFLSCCSSATLFWGGLALLVATTCFGAIFFFRRSRSPMHQHEAALLSPHDFQEVPEDEDDAVGGLNTSAPALNTDDDRPPGPCLTDPLMPSDASMVRSPGSPREPDDTRPPRRSSRQQLKPAMLRAESTGHSDMVLYMPGDGWSTRSDKGGMWIWSAHHGPGTDASGQNSAAGSLSSQTSRRIPPPINLSPPRGSLVAGLPVVVVKGTADISPFESNNKRTHDQSVDSSEFSSSTDSDCETTVRVCNSDDDDNA